MANLFKVGDSVVCQKKGGRSGTKNVSPPFPGTVAEVLTGGTRYRVEMKPVGVVHSYKTHFKGGIVDEQFMTLA